MDMISDYIPPIEVENSPIPTPTPTSTELNLVKQEQSDMTITDTGDIPPAPFINSINELRSLSAALSTFFSRYDELHNHVNFIKSSIDSKLPNHLLYSANPNQSALTIETSCANTVTTAPEAMVSEQSPKRTASNCVRSHGDLKESEEMNDVSKKSLETEASKIDVSKKPLQTDTSKKPEEIDDASKKPEETDTSKKPLETDVSKKLAEIDVSKKPEETDLLNNPEETDTTKKAEEIDDDVLKKPLETNTSKTPEETDVSMKPEETDVSNKPEEIDTSKKPEEIDDVSMEPEEIDDFSKKPLDTDASKMPEEIDESKKPEETEISKKPEETDDLSKKPLETDASNMPEKIDLSKKPEETEISKKPEETEISKKPEEVDDVSKKPLETDDLSKKPLETDASKMPEEIVLSKKSEETEITKKPAVTELESICVIMNAKKLKKYVAIHISNMTKLRQEVPKALKLAKDPAHLVLESIGAFFLQNCRAYQKGSIKNEHIIARLASVLILECFVMISSDGIEITNKDKNDAKEAAIRWRKRMIKEDRFRDNDEIDARGLLLLISGFGIPKPFFRVEDITQLIMDTNVKMISTALRRSIFLIPRVPDVIDCMVKNNLDVQAANIAYTFGLEDKCHPEAILTTFLLSNFKDDQNGSLNRVQAAKMLSDLKSVKKCLETHKVDPSNLHLDFKINEKIQHFEKLLYELNSKSTQEKSTQKRKAKETESSRHESKRTYIPSHENTPHEQHRPIYNMNPFDRSTQTVEPFMTNGFTGSYGTGVYGRSVPDQTVHPQPYGWHEGSGLGFGQPYSRQSQTYDSHPLTTGLYGRPSGRSPLESFPGFPESSTVAGFSGRRGPSSDIYGFADTVAGFPGRRGPSSDLYSFADTVEMESRDSRASGSGTVRSSYLY